MKRIAAVLLLAALASFVLARPSLADCAAELKELKQRVAQAPRTRSPSKEGALLNIEVAESALAKSDEKACLEAVRRGSASIGNQ